MAELSKQELVKSILEETQVLEDEQEIIGLLVKEKVSRNINSEHKDRLSFGDKMSDKLARGAGSWAFVISFLLVIGLMELFKKGD